MMVEWQTKDGMSIAFPAKYLAPQRTLILLWRPPKPLLRGARAPPAPPASTPLPLGAQSECSLHVHRKHFGASRWRQAWDCGGAAYTMNFRRMELPRTKMARNISKINNANRSKMGLSRESNPEPLAPKARIIPLDH